MLMRPSCATAQTFALRFPLQKAETSIDSSGCLHLVASASSNAKIEDLFDGLSHPEELYAAHTMVFVLAPQTRESPLKNTWTITSPFEEILEVEAVQGRIHIWDKYTFNRNTYTLLTFYYWRDHIASKPRRYPRAVR